MSKIPKPSDDSHFSKENRYSFPKLNIVKTFSGRNKMRSMQTKIRYDSVPAYMQFFTL